MNESLPLEIDNLAVAYHKEPVIYDINLKIFPGKIIGIIGPNGAGKTTLFRAILGLNPILQGKIRIFGQPFKKSLKRVGYVPQKESVDWDFPVNVYDVIMMGRYPHIGLFRKPNERDHKIVAQAIEKVSLQGLEHRQISNLSGGQQQRVFLARALVQESDLYFMDEPFAGVDATTEKTIIKVLTSLKEQGKTILIIHHDLATAQEYFDGVVFLNRQIIAQGPVNEVFTAENLERTFEGTLHIFKFNESKNK